MDEDSVHYESIVTIRSLGIIRGTSATTFSPWQPVERAQAATMLARLWRVAGWTCPGSSTPAFTDVEEGSDHAANIGCLSALGVARGTSATTFSPWQPVERAQAATLLARLWVAAGRTCPTAAVLTFDDVAGGHASGIECMTALGVVRGTTTGEFLPWQPVARAQMATLVARFYRALTD